MSTLGSIISFSDETTFGLADEQTTVTGVSGISTTPADGIGKVLFDQLDTLDGVVNGAAVLVDGVTYEMEIDTAYDGQILAVINGDRLSTQFTYDSSTNVQTASAEGYNVQSPTLRRLYHLGYV